MQFTLASWPHHKPLMDIDHALDTLQETPSTNRETVRILR